MRGFLANGCQILKQGNQLSATWSQAVESMCMHIHVEMDAFTKQHDKYEITSSGERGQHGIANGMIVVCFLLL